jgi:hypothetical protein
VERRARLLDRGRPAGVHSACHRRPTLLVIERDRSNPPQRDAGPLPQIAGSVAFAILTERHIEDSPSLRALSSEQADEGHHEPE